MRRYPRLLLTASLSSLLALTGCGPVANPEEHVTEEQPLVATRTFGASADARVESGAPSTNFGTSTLLFADSSPLYRTYLRFNVQNVAGTVTRAVVRLYVVNGSPNGPALYRTSGDWSETGVTWNNKPAQAGAALDDKGNTPAGAWTELNVSAAVKGNGSFDFVLVGTSSDGIQAHSREGANKPQLVLTVDEATTPPPPPSDVQPAFPIRAAFYYPWFPETWGGTPNPFTHYHPSLGFYRSDDLSVISKHIQAMQYGGFHAALSSWWGQGHYTDTRLKTILGKTAGTTFRWGVYYEKESIGNPTVAELQSDLAYIKGTLGGDPSFLRVAGRPVVFSFADGTDNCGMVDGWKQANASVNAYLVLKVFAGYQSCASQPDAWHQYGPAVAEHNFTPDSFNIAPSFWLANEATPRLGRDLARWNTHIRNMLASGAKWQLVTSFNEWGEGHAVESASEWATSSGQGAYLDALHTLTGTVPCTRTTCAAQGKNCGSIPDGCGGTLSCGSCTAPQTCGGGGSANVCGGTSCTPTPCAAQGKNCGNIPDGCGGTLSCGSCTAPQTCGGGGSANVCGGGAVGSMPVIAIAGDIAGSWAEDEATAKLIDAMNPDAVLTLGDNVYSSGTASEFTTHYAPTWGRHKAKTRPSPGNHDHATSGLSGYCNYFGASAHCQGGYGYYSFDLGDWHIISLDSGCSSPSSCGDPMAAGSAMRTWLTNDLKASTKKCTLAYWHHPRWSSGSHGNDPRSSGVWTELYNAGVDVVMNGHDHHYERFSPQSPSGSLDNARGLVEFLVGTGGTGLRSAGGIANSVVRNSSSHGVLKFSLKPDGYDFEFVPVAGKTFTDKGSGQCH